MKIKMKDLPVPPEGKGQWPWVGDIEVLPDSLPDGSSWPKISLITPSYNQGEYIEETIRSVLLQGYPNLEYIIIDGGSNDSTVEIIKKYEPYIRYWISESDRGQSHAINKGLLLCTGDIVNWLNSDDLLCPGALEAIARKWAQFPGHLIAGGVEDFSSKGTVKIHIQNELSLDNYVRWSMGDKPDLVWHQPGIFLPLPNVKKIGGVREDMRYTMDRFLLLELLRTCKVAYVDKILARFRIHHTSKTVSMGQKFHLEFMEGLQSSKGLSDLFPPGKLRWLYSKALVNQTIRSLMAGNQREAVTDLKMAYSVSFLAASWCLFQQPLAMSWHAFKKKLSNKR